jgi:transposase
MPATTHDIDYRKLYEEGQQTNLQLQQMVEKLQLELMQLKKLIFGSRHERFINTGAQPGTTGLLFDVEAIADTATQTIIIPEKQVQKQTVVSKHKGRNEFPAGMRRKEILQQPQGLDTATAKRIGEDVTELLAYQPCELYIKKIIRPKYLLPGTNTIIQAPAAPRAIDKGNADSSLLAQVAIEKYIDHLPLYRQVKRYERLGISISESSIGEWVAATARCVEPLYNRHKELVLASRYIHADETTIRVMDSEKKNATHQGYYWVYQSHHEKLVLFDYQSGRGREGPAGILENYQGWLQTDGYGVYENIALQPGIIQLCCMAHARRKFTEALSNDRIRAEYALAEMQKLYAIERHAVEYNIKAEALTAYRNEHAIPLLEALGQWMEKAYLEVLPKSTIGMALGYSIERWERLSLYATNGLLHIDNNPVENSIRPVAIGRKNYLFAGSHAAAQRSAIFYSLFATCKNHGINPYDWLHDILDRINTHPQKKIDDLLPQNWKQPG